MLLLGYVNFVFLFSLEHLCSGTVLLGTVNAPVLHEATTIQHAWVVLCLPSVIVVYDNNYIPLLQ